jgi:hypothetical protein
LLGAGLPRAREKAQRAFPRFAPVQRDSVQVDRRLAGRHHRRAGRRAAAYQCHFQVVGFLLPILSEPKGSASLV